MFGSAIWVAGEAYLAVGRHTGAAIDADDALPLVVLIATRLLVNELIFSGAEWRLVGAAIRPGVLGRRARCVRRRASREGCLGVLVAYGYSRETWVVLLFIAPLLALLYQASAGFERLKGETTNVLNTFAGVIDERDPLDRPALRAGGRLRQPLRRGDPAGRARDRAAGRRRPLPRPRQGRGRRGHAVQDRRG